MGLITKGTTILPMTNPFHTVPTDLPKVCPHPPLGAHLDSIETDELEVFHREITLEKHDQRGRDPFNYGSN